jgi:succinate dehydrogenase / fumarate reductase iron-sulfur subunit
MNVKLKVFRFNPETDQTPHYDPFEVEANPNDRVLDCLNRIRWTQDGTLAFRMSCGHGICGSDGLTINGSPALACQKLVEDYDYSKEIVVEPLRFFPVMKDLVVDLEPFFARLRAIHPETREPKVEPDEPSKGESLQSVTERTLFDDAIKCILCACCVSACPVNLHEDSAFIGPAALLRAQRYIFDSRTQNSLERMHVLEMPHGVWSCKSYYQCTRVCPKKIRVTEAILRTKKKILEELHPKQDKEG